MDGIEISLSVLAASRGTKYRYIKEKEREEEGINI